MVGGAVDEEERVKGVVELTVGVELEGNEVGVGD